MFKEKQKNLLEVSTKRSSSNVNSFVNEGLRKSNLTLSGNMALKYKSTGNDFLDQFAKLGLYKELRTFEAISSDMTLLWSQDPIMALRFTFYLRIITRKVKFPNGESTDTIQRGAGLRHESIMRMIWIAVNYPDVFWKNLHLFISIGSWKDLITMMQYDLEFHGKEGLVLDHKMLYGLVLAGLHNSNTVDLVLKYLPQIKSNQKCTTVRDQARNIIAKGLAKTLGITYQEYRQLKSSGKAHTWQQLISKKQFNKIDFNSIHGRALALLAGGKFIENQGLEAKYLEWIKSQPVAKYTGYVHELLSKINMNMPEYRKHTINKQFDGLVQLGKTNANTDSRFIVVRDTSGSMVSVARGTSVSCYDIAKSLALYFSEFLEGAFKDAWIEFNTSAKMHTWKGNTVVDKWLNDYSNTIGNTEFLSVAKLFASIKNKGVKESEFPTGILCISDSEFNPAQLGETNVENFRNILKSAGFSTEFVNNFKIVLWNLQSSYYGDDTGTKFETYGNHTNVYYFSGYEASIIAFLTGTDNQKSIPKSADELFLAAMDQEVLDMIEY